MHASRIQTIYIIQTTFFHKTNNKNVFSLVHILTVYIQDLGIYIQTLKLVRINYYSFMSKKHCSHIPATAHVLVLVFTPTVIRETLCAWEIATVDEDINLVCATDYTVK